MSGRVMVFGLGNPDRGDDGIGPLVADALREKLPPGVELHTRSGNLLTLVEDWEDAEAVVCIDAAAPMGTPGRIHRLDPSADPLPPSPGQTSSHGMGLPEALALSLTLGTAPARIIVYAVEGAAFEAGAPITPAVADAVATVAGRVRAEVETLCAMEPAHA